MKKAPPFYEVKPVQKEILSPKEFLRVARERPLSISRSRFVPPTPGRMDFGAFEVEYTLPMLKRVAA